jgi:hypothetical protein
MVLAAFAASSEAAAIGGTGLNADTDSPGDWELNGTLLTVKHTTTITGTISAPIQLDIQTGATVNWQAAGTGSSAVDLIQIIDSSVGDSFEVNLNGGTLSNLGSVLVNESEVPVNVLGGTLESTGTDDEYVTLSSKGEVAIDSDGATITITSASAYAVFVDGNDIEILGDDDDIYTLTIRTEAEGYSAVRSVNGGDVTVDGDSSDFAKTNISAIGGDNSGIRNDDGNISITDALIVVSDAESWAVNALNGNVIMGGNSLIRLLGEDNIGIYAHNGNVTVKGDARIEADDDGGVAVYSQKGDVSLEDNADLSADKGGPVVEARGGDITVGATVTVDAGGSSNAVALRASGDIIIDPANTTGITGEQYEHHDYSPTAPPSSSGGCDAGFGAISLIGLGLCLVKGRRGREA